MTPPHLDSGVTTEQTERALQAMTERLRVEGYRIISQGQAVSAMAALSDASDGPSAHECTTQACAARFRAFFEAEMAVHLSAYRDASYQGAGASSVRVALVEGEDVSWSGQSGIGDGDVESAALQALSVARQRRTGGVGPWLSVDGSPHGAEVFVDGVRAGVLPYEGLVEAGSHRVEVRAAGLPSHVERVDVGSTGERQLRVALGEGSGAMLAPDAVALEAVGGDRGATAAYDYAAGGAMIVGGIALAVIVPAITAAKSGQCADGSEDLTTCPEVYEVNGGVWTQVVLGAALVGGGAGVMWTKPIQLMMGADRQSARVTVRGTF